MSRYRDTRTRETPINTYGLGRNRNSYNNPPTESMKSDIQSYDDYDNYDDYDDEFYSDNDTENDNAEYDNEYDKAEYHNYDEFGNEEYESSEPVVVDLRGSFGDTDDIGIGGDPTEEPSEAAWIDEKGLTPQIRLGDKLYYLNKFNWNWLKREASAGDNNELLRANIRSPRDLQMYIAENYPGLKYVNRDMNRGESPYNKNSLLPPLSSRYSRQSRTPDRVARPVNPIEENDINSESDSEFNYDDYGDEAEYRGRTPKRAYSARV